MKLPLGLTTVLCVPTVRGKNLCHRKMQINLENFEGRRNAENLNETFRKKIFKTFPSEPILTMDHTQYNNIIQQGDRLG